MATSTIAPPNPAQTEEQDTGGASVAEEQSPAAPPSFGKNNRHLPDELKAILKDIVTEFQNENLYDRRIEDLMDRKMRFYDDGVQHFYPDWATGAYQIGSAGAYVDIGDYNFECSEYMSAYNIFRARRRTIDSVLTQSPPGIVFEADHPERSEDIEAAETAEGYRHLFDQANDISDIQQAITRYFELSGRVVAWTHTAANQQKWGMNDQGEPRQMETCEVFGTLESVVPILARDQDCAIYAGVFKDIHIFRARRENPWLKEPAGSWKMAGGETAPGESEWKKYARLAVRQSRKGSAVLSATVANILTEMHFWMRPDAFESTKCATVYTGPIGWDEDKKQYINEPFLNEEDEPGTIGELLEAMFPEGAHVKFVGKALSEATPESMDDALDIVMSEKRDSLTGGALMEPMTVVQDGFNDFKNAEREFYEKGWPMTHFKGDTEDYDVIIKQQSRPAQFNLIKNAVGGPEVPLENSFYKEPDMNVPQSFQSCMEEYRGPLSQDITGASPALEGVAGPHDETASQRAMDKAQSVGILGPTWSRVQKTFAGIYKKAALCASRNPDHAKEITVATGENQTTVIQLQKLSRGKFHCKPDSDSSFPDSTAAQRANLDATLPLIMPTPIGAEILSSPDNWEEMFRIKGMSDFTVVPAIAFRKQQRELEILLRESPVPNAQAVEQYNQQHAQQALQDAANGLAPQPYAPPPSELPSIMPKKRDFHNWELAKCREFLSSENAWRIEVEGVKESENAQPVPPPPQDLASYSTNPHIRNVELHADWHEKMMAMFPQPGALPMAPPAAKGAPPNAAAPQANTQVQGAAQPPGAPNQPTL